MSDSKEIHAEAVKVLHRDTLEAARKIEGAYHRFIDVLVGNPTLLREGGSEKNLQALHTLVGIKAALLETAELIDSLTAPAVRVWRLSCRKAECKWTGTAFNQLKAIHLVCKRCWGPSLVEEKQADGSYVETTCLFEIPKK